MLTVVRTATPSQQSEIALERRVGEQIDGLLGNHEARIFPPDTVLNCWQIFVRYSPITTSYHAPVGAAFEDLHQRLTQEMQSPAAVPKTTCPWCPATD